MIGSKNNRSVSYIIGILYPAIIIITINLYGLIFQYSNKYTKIATDILIIFMFFNIGLREIITKKSKFGYFFVILAVFLLLRCYKYFK